MNKNFNLFRLNCMMGDSELKNYNSIIASLIAELLFQNDNKELDWDECHKYLNKDLKIPIQQDVFRTIIENSKYFVPEPSLKGVDIKLTSKKFYEINNNIENYSIEKFISKFLKEKKLSAEFASKIEALLYQAIYENINSFTIHNVNSILPKNASDNFSRDEIGVFNEFLAWHDKTKNIVLFNTFLNATEFAILTSGKGITEFTKGVFEGKEYILDANIIFRLLGVGGEERKDSLLKLIEKCSHQGIKFFYSHQSHQELIRKIKASIRDIKRATGSQSMAILEEMVEEKNVEFNQSFVIHYAQYKLDGLVKSPDQYELKVLTDFRILCEKYGIQSISALDAVSLREADKLTDKFFDWKKEKGTNNYTKTAAKVDAVNVLMVRKIRGKNDYNYSDIKSFYLTTDRTLNKILAEKALDNIAETILPSQLFILHNSLSEESDDKDYEAFTKFLKRRTTGFKYGDKEVLDYIDEIRNFTNEPENIKEILKAYSDKKYSSASEIGVSQNELMSIKEFSETYLDKKIQSAESGDGKFRKAYDVALEYFPEYLEKAKRTVRIVDLVSTAIFLPLIIYFFRLLAEDIIAVAIAVIIFALIRFILSSRFDLYGDFVKYLFMRKVKTSSFHRTFYRLDGDFLEKAHAYIDKPIKVWK